MEEKVIEVEKVEPEDLTIPKKKYRKREELISEPGVTEEKITEAKPKRTYNKKNKKIDTLLDAESISSLAKQIEGIHMLASQISGIPEVVLSSDDSMALAGSVMVVCSQYNLSIDGKTGALLQLLGTASVIYIPRYFAFRRRIAENEINESNAEIS